jgi:hypothetical protein
VVCYFVLQKDERQILAERNVSGEVSIASACLFRAIDSYKIGPSIAIVLFQSRRVIGHWATISAVTG